jgi:RNA polymerase sigma-70 factor (ECF subfamily)
MIDIAGVIAEFGPALVRIAASYERDPSLREELVQEILLAIFRALPQLEDDRKLKPFIFRSAHNRAVSHVVKQMREPLPERVPDTPDMDAPDPERQWSERQRSERLLKAVRSLALPYRQVMVLVLEELTYEEIATALGLSVSNVGVRVNRAKTQLRERLNHD